MASTLRQEASIKKQLLGQKSKSFLQASISLYLELEILIFSIFSFINLQNIINEVTENEKDNSFTYGFSYVGWLYSN